MLPLSLGRHDRFCGCLPVSGLECFLAFVNRRAVSGFGLGFLVSRGFLGAKAPLDPQSLAIL